MVFIVIDPASIGDPTCIGGNTVAQMLSNGAEGTMMKKLIYT